MLMGGVGDLIACHSYPLSCSFGRISVIGKNGKKINSLGVFSTRAHLDVLLTVQHWDESRPTPHVCLAILYTDSTLMQELIDSFQLQKNV